MTPTTTVTLRSRARRRRLLSRSYTTYPTPHPGRRETDLRATPLAAVSSRNPHTRRRSVRRFPLVPGERFLSLFVALPAERSPGLEVAKTDLESNPHLGGWVEGWVTRILAHFALSDPCVTSVVLHRVPIPISLVLVC